VGSVYEDFIYPHLLTYYQIALHPQLLIDDY